MKKSIKKLLALVTMVCLCAIMAVPAFATSDSDVDTLRLMACPNCNSGGVIQREIKLSENGIDTRVCTHGYYNRTDVLIEVTWQTEYSCTRCNWKNIDGTYNTYYWRCLGAA